MISLINLEKTQNTRNGIISLLHDIDLNIEKGEVFGLIGRSHAEKSAFLRCINFMSKPTGGQVIIENQSLNNLSEKELLSIRAKIGYLFPHFNLLEQKTVFENIALPLELEKYKKNEITSVVSKILDEMNFTGKSVLKVSQLTNEEKQIVALARCLTRNPTVLLCDHPTNKFDSKATTNFLQLLKNIKSKYQLSIIIATNKIEVIKFLCDRVGVLESGKLISKDSIWDFLTKPQTQSGKEYIKNIAKQDLPLAIRRRLQNTHTENEVPIFRFSYLGKLAIEPLFAHLIQKLFITINVIQAHIENVQNENIGIMIAELNGKPDSIGKAINFLRNKGLFSEVIGYVPRAGD